MHSAADLIKKERSYLALPFKCKGDHSVYGFGCVVCFLQVGIHDNTRKPEVLLVRLGSLQ